MTGKREFFENLHFLNLTDSSRHKRIKILVSFSLQNFHNILQKLFYTLGYLVAEHPAYFIVIPLFIALIGITGIKQIIYETDPEYLFTPDNGKGRQDRAVVETLFPIDYSKAFDPFRITRPCPFIFLKVLAKDNGGTFRENVFRDITTMDEAIRNMSIEFEQKTYNYEDICAKMYAKCIENNVLDLKEYMADIENGDMEINYPVMLYPLVVPFYLGGVTVNETEGIILETKAISLYYWLKNDNAWQKERSIAFERKVLQYLEETNFEHISVVSLASRSLTDELDRNVQSVTPYFIYLIILILAFTIGSLFMSDWVRMKLYMGLIGILTASLATGCSFGFLMYCGISFIGINMSAPFLTLGIGLDDMFVILSAWHRTKIQEPVPERLGKTYSEAAASITITSLTSMLSFFLGAITPFPAVKIFCIYVGFASLFTYIGFITFFGGCLAMAGYQESKGLHNVSCRVVLPKSVAENMGMGCSYKFWCTGGYNPEDTLNPKDNEPHSVMIFFRDYLGSALNVTSIKVLVIFIFIIYFCGAIYGCTQVKEGLELSNLALDNSYICEYFDVEEKLFRKYPYAIQVIIADNLTYSEPETKREILKLHETFDSLNTTATPLFTQSWMKSFYKFLDRKGYNITSEMQFIDILKSEYLTPGRKSPDILDVKFNGAGTQIIASRFVIQAYDIENIDEDVKMMIELRNIAEQSPFNVVVFNLFFLIFDQFLLVKQVFIQTIVISSVVMMLVALIFIPSPLCSLWVAFAIISIEVGVIGYMSLWKINIDTISMINLIMCVGFSVDFSAHISYSYITSQAITPAGKVKDCLFSMGLPILQGGLSTITGVIVLMDVPSYVFNVFFKINFLVITFGLMHSLLLLPVMLSIIGPKSKFSEESEHSNDTTLELSTGSAIKPTSTVFEKNTSENKNNLTVITSKDDTFSEDLGSSGFSSLSSSQEEIETSSVRSVNMKRTNT